MNTATGREIHMPLTFQQTFLWKRLQRYALLDSAIPVGLRLRGRVNVDALTTAVEGLLWRHEGFRTEIVLNDGIPMQRIGASREYRLEIGKVSGADVGQVGRALYEEWCGRKLSPGADALFRVALLEYSDQDCFLLWSIHNLITDAFSLHLMFRELWLSYAELLSGHTSTLRSLSVTMQDYVVWQREAHRAWLREHGDYWKERLAGAAPVGRQAQDRGIETPHGSEVSILVPFGEELSQQLRDFARCSQVLLPLVMLAVYAAAVSRWSGQRDFVVPFQVTGRDRAEHQSIIGYLVQLLYLRIELTGYEKVSGLLNHIKQEFYRALLHRDSGWIASEASDELSRTCFRWMGWNWSEVVGVPTSVELARLNFSVERLGVMAEVDWWRERISPRVQDNVPLVFDLSVTFWVDVAGGGLLLAVTGRAELFARNSIERFAQSLLRKSEQLIRDPNGFI